MYQTFPNTTKKPNEYRATNPNTHPPKFEPQQFPTARSPVQYQTTQNYSPTMAGPVLPDQGVQRSAYNDAMAQGAYVGDRRAYLGQSGPGVRAGGNMAAYRAGLAADAASAKSYAQANQSLLNLLSSTQSANLNYQQQQAGEQSWLRDLLLDRDNVRNRERMAAYKRRVDWELAAYQRRAEDAVARDRREAQIWSSLL